MDRYCADRMVKRLVKRAGIDKRISPHSLRHSFITAALDAGVPLRDVQEATSHADPRTTMRYDRGPTQPRPPRHLHRVHVHRRSNQTGLSITHRTGSTRRRRALSEVCGLANSSSTPEHDHNQDSPMSSEPVSALALRSGDLRDDGVGVAAAGHGHVG